MTEHNLDGILPEDLFRALTQGDSDVPVLPGRQRGPSPEDLEIMKADREGYVRFMSSMVDEADAVSKRLLKLVSEGRADQESSDLQVKISMWKAAAKAKWIHPALIPIPGGAH